MIDESILVAFRQCPLKAHFLLSGRVPPKTEHQELDERVEHALVARLLRSSSSAVTGAPGLPLTDDDLATHPHALERAGRTNVFVPLRVFPRARISNLDRATLGFDGLVVGHALGKVPAYAIAILGPDLRRSRIALPRLVRRARRAAEAIRALASAPAPRLILNRHCETCGFRDECRRKAVDSDDLSLLSGLKKVEIEAAHKKGIFTITQFSHSFRPNRRRKHVRHEWALQALSIREKRTHILVPLELPSRTAEQHALFFDVEGDLDATTYYLVGVRHVSAAGTTQHSFWADRPEQEETIWRRLLDLVEGIADFTAFHYGRYETVFLRRMAKRYPAYKPEIAARLRERATNVVGLIHGHVHFPTLSNGLKDIAAHLGFRWTEAGATGLQCALWRRRWELDPDAETMARIVTYNADDCAALHVVVDRMYAIRDGAPGAEVVDAASLKTRGTLGKFKKNVFAFPELEFINNCAYFDYQREHILLRTSAAVRQALRREEAATRRRPRVNKVIDYRTSSSCPTCGSGRISENGHYKKRQTDLRFGPGYVKRWVTVHVTAQYRCRSCQKIWFPAAYLKIRGKLGRNLGCWIVSQTIAHRQSHGAIVASVGEAFGIRLRRQQVQVKKEVFAESYRSTYRDILRRVACAPMVQVDETKVTVRGAAGYVWVFAAAEDVAFVYAGSRDASTPERVLAGFDGVLVSDFYAAYDSMPCAQQKCLIHLIRDLNEDLFRNQLDDELRELARAFTDVLRPIISTIDGHGLKRRWLAKHRKPADDFLGDLAARECRSEVAEKCRARLVKCGAKLFTFLDHDGVPWNNNGAENAVKDFVMMRRRVEGLSTEGRIANYLVLLSIRQTLKRRGCGFLPFLLSGEKDIERFSARSSA